MSQPADSSTSLTFMGRLQRDSQDPTVWREFVVRYGRRLYEWCKRYGLQDADAEDVTQNVLVKLHSAFRSFVYDPSKSFRGYLRTATRNAWHSWAEKQPQERGTGDSKVLERLKQVQARDELLSCLEEQFDMEIVEEASRRVQLRVEPHNWEAFYLRVFQGLSGKEVAARLEMEVATVYAIQKRVRDMLKAEIETLQIEGEDQA